MYYQKKKKKRKKRKEEAEEDRYVFEYQRWETTVATYMFQVTIPLLVKMIDSMVILSSLNDNSHDGSLKKKKKKSLKLNLDS